MISINQNHFPAHLEVHLNLYLRLWMLSSIIVVSKRRRLRKLTQLLLFRMLLNFHCRWGKLKGWFSPHKGHLILYYHKSTSSSSGGMLREVGGSSIPRSIASLALLYITHSLPRRQTAQSWFPIRDSFWGGNSGPATRHTPCDNLLRDTWTIFQANVRCASWPFSFFWHLGWPTTSFWSYLLQFKDPFFEHFVFPPEFLLIVPEPFKALLKLLVVLSLDRWWLLKRKELFGYKLN